MKVNRGFESGRGMVSRCGGGLQLMRAALAPAAAVAVIAALSACGSKAAKDTSPNKPPPSTSPAPAAAAAPQTQPTDTGANKDTGKAGQNTAANPSGAVTEVKPVAASADSVAKTNASPATQSTITASNSNQGNLLNGILATAGTNLITQSLLKDNPKLATALTTCLFTLGLGLMDSSSILASIQKVTGTAAVPNGTTQNTQVAALTGCLTNLIK